MQQSRCFGAGRVELFLDEIDAVCGRGTFSGYNTVQLASFVLMGAPRERTVDESLKKRPSTRCCAPSSDPNRKRINRLLVYDARAKFR